MEGDAVHCPPDLQERVRLHTSPTTQSKRSAPQVTGSVRQVRGLVRQVGEVNATGHRGQDCRSEGKYGRSENSTLQVIGVRTAGQRVSTAGRRGQHYRSLGQDCRSEGKYRGLLQVRGISTEGRRVRRVRDGGDNTTREKNQHRFSCRCVLWRSRWS